MVWRLWQPSAFIAANGATNPASFVYLPWEGLLSAGSLLPFRVGVIRLIPDECTPPTRPKPGGNLRVPAMALGGAWQNRQRPAREGGRWNRPRKRYPWVTQLGGTGAADAPLRDKAQQDQSLRDVGRSSAQNYGPPTKRAQTSAVQWAGPLQGFGRSAVEQHRAVRIRIPRRFAKRRSSTNIPTARNNQTYQQQQAKASPTKSGGPKAQTRAAAEGRIE